MQILSKLMKIDDKLWCKIPMAMNICEENVFYKWLSNLPFLPLQSSLQKCRYSLVYNIVRGTKAKGSLGSFLQINTTALLLNMRWSSTPMIVGRDVYQTGIFLKVVLPFIDQVISFKPELWLQNMYNFSRFIKRFSEKPYKYDLPLLILPGPTDINQALIIKTIIF